MKRILFAGISLIALAVAGTAGAADLPRRGTAPAATPVYMQAAYNWSGFYAGIVGGWGFGNSEWSSSPSDFDVSGGLIGGTLGYNWQNGRAVIGVETDLAWTSIDGTSGARKTENNWLGTTRARLGYAVDRWMPYVTGGLAYGDIKAHAVGLPSERDSNVGWTVGAGAEVAVAGNWTAKGEYLYVDLGDVTCNAGNCGSPTKVDFTSHVLRGGLNYRF